MSRATKPASDPSAQRRGEGSTESTPSAESVIHALMGTTHILGRAFDARLASFDLPVRLSGPRLHLLIAVEHAGRLRMGDAAAELGITPRTVTTLVDGLERDGLLARVADPDDRRATLLELTPMACEHFAHVHALQQQLAEEVAAGLDASERRQLLDLLMRLRASVGEHDCARPRRDEGISG